MESNRSEFGLPVSYTTDGPARLHVLSFAVFALAICDMNVRESVTSWASSFALLHVSDHASLSIGQAHSWSRYKAPSLTRAVSWSRNPSSSSRSQLDTLYHSDGADQPSCSESRGRFPLLSPARKKQALQLDRLERFDLKGFPPWCIDIMKVELQVTMTNDQADRDA